MAALPACDNDKLAAAIRPELPWFKLVSSVLETSIDNLNAMMHPAPMLLNTSRIEADPFVPFQYYLDGRESDCVRECDELIAAFGDGKYVYAAMLLKKKYRELDPAQQKIFDNWKEEKSAKQQAEEAP